MHFCLSFCVNKVLNRLLEYRFAFCQKPDKTATKFRIAGAKVGGQNCHFG